MATVGKKICAKCGRSLKETEFFKMKTGERHRFCKDCLTQYIDNRNPETFLWILKEFDVPYIKEIWVKQTNEAYLKNPGKFGPKSVIGGYMRTLNMKQYESIHYEHSADTLDEARAKSRGEEYEAPQSKTEEEEKTTKEELDEKLEKGEISQAEYDTLVNSSAFGQMEFVDMSNPEPQEEDESQGFISPFAKDESYWNDQLTGEDIDYLLLKWGKVYTPEQWIKMETIYQKYAEEYDLNSDREEVLKKMCKTSLKMDEALDTGDITAYKNLATVFDQLRKSGRFTEAQKKEEKRELLSTIGELAALCEQHGGIIPVLPEFDMSKYPQDIIDFELKDFKAYTYHLVSDELRLGDLIESYITKLEKSEQDSLDVNLGLVTSAEEAEAQKLRDEAFYKSREQTPAELENSVEAEADELFRLIDQALDEYETGDS